MRMFLQRSVLALGLFLVLAQIYRPTRTHPQIHGEQQFGADVTAEPVILTILERSCNGCHSNRTLWPWYSQIAPVSWFVVSDVNRGRRRVNFSEWGSYAADKGSKLLEAICKEVSEGDMPPITYTSMHPSAKLTKSDAQEICRWTAAARQTVAASTSKGVAP